VLDVVADDLTDALARGPLFRFADWPVAEVPESPGAYTLWNPDQLLYCGRPGVTRPTSGWSPQPLPSPSASEQGEKARRVSKRVTQRADAGDPQTV
jgi:hypothetical protein